MDISLDKVKQTIKQIGKFLLDHKFIENHIKELIKQKQRLDHEKESMTLIKEKDHKHFQDAIKRNTHSLENAEAKLNYILNEIARQFNDLII